MTVRHRTCHTLYEPKYGKPVKITVWNNKDFESTGNEMTVHPKCMRSWNNVLDFLTMMLQPRQGAVRKIYHLNTKKLVCCLEEIQSNEKYVAVGAEKVKFKKNGYLTKEERKAQGLTKPSTGWNNAHHLYNVKSLENFMQMTQKNKRTVLYVMVSGRTNQVPLKVVLIERDLLDPKVLLDYLAYRLDVGEGIKYLCNRNGRIMKPYKLKHGDLYIAVPFSGKFIKLDYAKMFKEILPQRTLQLLEATTGKKRKKKDLEAQYDYSASAPQLETFVDPKSQEDKHAFDFSTFNLQLPCSYDGSPAASLSKKVSFDHHRIMEPLGDLASLGDLLERAPRASILRNRDELNLQPIIPPRDDSEPIHINSFLNVRDSIYCGRMKRKSKNTERDSKDWKSKDIAFQTEEQIMGNIYPEVFVDHLGRCSYITADSTESSFPLTMQKKYWESGNEPNEIEIETNEKCIQTDEQLEDYLIAPDLGGKCSYIETDTDESQTDEKIMKDTIVEAVSEEPIQTPTNEESEKYLIIKVPINKTDNFPVGMQKDWIIYDPNEMNIENPNVPNDEKTNISITTDQTNSSVGIQKSWTNNKDELEAKSVQVEIIEVASNPQSTSTKDISDIYENYDKASYLSSDTTTATTTNVSQGFKCHMAECLRGCSLICLNECPDDNECFVDLQK